MNIILHLFRQTVTLSAVQSTIAVVSNNGVVIIHSLISELYAVLYGINSFTLNIGSLLLFDLRRFEEILCAQQNGVSFYFL